MLRKAEGVEVVLYPATALIAYEYKVKHSQKQLRIFAHSYGVVKGLGGGRWLVAFSGGVRV